jgi:excisionase family DNA binding protein
VIVPSGVLVPAEQARLIGQLAAEEVRRQMITDPNVLRLIEELLSVSTSAAGQNVESFEQVAETAERLKVHPRTIRRWASAGKVPAVKRGGQWLVQRTESQRLDGSRVPSETR